VTPLAYLAAVVAIAMLLLPSALRPPPEQTTNSAEFSPDAPPDDKAPDAIISSLQQAGSSGAGEELASKTGEVGPNGAPLTATTTTVQLRAPRGACFGDPPRQTDSLYSTECAPGWVGNNGGATTKGVTADEFRVAWMIGSNDSAPEGPVEDTPPAGKEPDSSRFARIYQSYFNQRYELYGRRLRMVLVKHPLTGEAEGRAAVDRAADQFNAFAVLGISTNAGALDEAVQRHLVTWIDSENPQDYYAKNHPYIYSFNMDADKIVDFTSEMICKQLAGKPVTFNEHQDATMDYSKRVFGLVLYEDQTRYGSEELFNKDLSRCGEHLKLTVKHNLYDNQQGDGGAMTKLRAAGVTTIIVGGDPITPVVFTNEASNSRYYPEWINVGTSGLNTNGGGQLFNQDEWKHSIGIFYPELPRPSVQQDYYRAYKSVDPGGTPGASSLFRQLQMVVNGVQGAGAKLTPESFWDGLQKMPHRPPDPVWSIGGAFGPNDFTYSDFMSMVWWDPEAKDPEEDLPGAYRWLYGGQRFARGQLPTEPAPFFQDGVITADEAQAYWDARKAQG
jgi:hypothetical protein